MIEAIITDIEGTTTDIAFVHSVLFPYSRQKMASFLEQNHKRSEVHSVVKEICSIIDAPEASLYRIVDCLLQWIDEDKKIGPLKTLQGYIWQEGFEKGEFKSHIYNDAYENLVKWHKQNIKLYVYSSGSKKAQQLLFQYSIYGDLRYLFSGYFDTTVGGKKEPSSYQNILHQLQLAGQKVLFLSDTPDEVSAAQKNGIHTALITRTEKAEGPHCHSFDEIQNLANRIIRIKLRAYSIISSEGTH